MKFLERNQMQDTRFSQSFNLIPNKTKLLNTTRASLQKTQQKLPQLNRSYSSTKNTNQKLAQMDDTIQDLIKKVNTLRLQTRVRMPTRRNQEGTGIFYGKTSGRGY